MKVIEHIQRSKGRSFSIEVLPPLKGESIRTLFDHLDPIMELQPAFIDVTYHREEYIYIKRKNGLLEKRSMRKRPGTVGICTAIQNHYEVDTVPHIICGGFSREETENALIDLKFLGIQNVLALQGDAIKTESNFNPNKDGHHYASDLLEQIVNMNKGVYLYEDLINATPTNFCVGVAGYPEKHFYAPNISSDIKKLKKKVDMGADYIVTQMFFDNQKYIDFVQMCRNQGINIPIVPGIKPITTAFQLHTLPKLFHIDIPETLSEEILRCSSKESVRKVGIEWAIEQSKQLLKVEAPLLHFYSMGKADPVYTIVKALF